jgi:glycosyltransferase involved in cell wall biosynthesis
VGFARRGYDVLVIASCEPGQEYNDDGLPYRIERIRFKRGLWEGKAFLIILRERIKNKNIAVVCGTWAAGGLPLMILKLIAGTPYFLLVYGMDILHSSLIRSKLFAKIRPYYLKKTCRFANQIWAISEYTAGILRSYSIEPEKIRIFPLPLRHDFEEIAKGEKKIEKESHPEKKILMTISRLDSYKGMDMVVKILPRLREKFGDVQYHIAGGGGYRDILEELVRENGMEQHVRIYGHVPDDDLPGLYALCDVFVMLSREDLQQGFVEGFGDEDDAFEKISSLLADPGYAGKLGEQGRKRVLDNFLVEHMIQTLEDCLMQSLSP